MASANGPPHAARATARQTTAHRARLLAGDMTQTYQRRGARRQNGGPSACRVGQAVTHALRSFLVVSLAAGCVAAPAGPRGVAPRSDALEVELAQLGTDAAPA